MKMNEPIGNAIFGPLVARIPLATYFMLAGYEKMQEQQNFIMLIKKFGVLPDLLATLVGIVLPYIEAVAGALLFLGAWTTLASILLSLAVGFYITAFGVFYQMPFNKDIALLGLSLSFLWSGSGGWSIDRFRKTG